MRKIDCFWISVLFVIIISTSVQGYNLPKPKITVTIRRKVIPDPLLLHSNRTIPSNGLYEVYEYELIYDASKVTLTQVDRIRRELAKQYNGVFANKKMD